MLTILLLAMAAFQVPTQSPRELAVGGYPDRNGVTAPVAIYMTQPTYTDDARDAGVKGKVRLRVIVDEKGFPTGITVVKPLFPSLDNSAIAAVAKWRFKPGMKAGVPADAQVLIEVSFSPL